MTSNSGRGGWEVYSGEDMLRYVRDHTGYDLRDLLQEVSAQPVVRQRLLDAHKEMIEQQKANLWSSYAYAPDEVREDFHDKIMENPTALNAIASRASSDPPRIEGLHQLFDPGRLRDRAEALCDKAITTLPQEKYDALLGILLTLEDDQRAELLSEALHKSSEKKLR